MPKLAFENRDGSGNFEPFGGKVKFHPGDAPDILQALLTKIAFYRLSYHGTAEFVAIADVESFFVNQHRGELGVTKPILIEPPIIMDDLVLDRNHTWITDEIMHQIVEEANSAERRKANADGFREDRTTDRTIETLAGSIMAKWDHTCALTHDRFSVQERLKGRLVLATLWPEKPEDLAHTKNLFPVSADFLPAVSEGQISFTSEHKFLLAPRLNPILSSRLHTSGTMFLPVDTRYWPLPENLSYHRDRIFRG